MSAINSTITFSFPEGKKKYFLFIKEKEIEIVNSSNSKVSKYPLIESDSYSTNLTHTIGHIFYSRFEKS